MLFKFRFFNHLLASIFKQLEHQKKKNKNKKKARNKIDSKHYPSQTKDTILAPSQFFHTTTKEKKKKKNGKVVEKHPKTSEKKTSKNMFLNSLFTPWVSSKVFQGEVCGCCLACLCSLGLLLFHPSHAQKLSWSNAL